LKVDDARLQGIRNDFKQHPQSIFCGISWRSNRPGLGVDKSFQLVDLVSALRTAGVAFVDLQYGDTAQELELVRERTGLRVLHYEGVDNYGDLEGHLALICACDLVVTVSNTTAHLAGAAGKSGIVLRRSSRSDFWYWHNLTGNQQSLWYPSLKVVDASDPKVLRDIDLARLVGNSAAQNSA
jgi:hypothetical protein